MAHNIAYFDCFSGASGDMILGALLDAGLSLEQLSEDISKLPCEGVRLRSQVVTRGGLRATQLHVDVAADSSPAHRGLGELSEIIQAANLSADVKSRAMRIFERLAEAEAHAHGVAPEEVHFHEIGALDSLADIVGAVCALERLGVDELYFSTLRLGGGTVRTAHGELPVPAPATSHLVAGLRCELGPVESELLTPTAAAILTTLGSQERPPAFRLQKTGCGAGSRDDPARPNVLRVLVGQTVDEAEADVVWVLEANLDDTTPEICGHALDRLLAAGALDAYIVPIQMKKSRSGWMLCALATDAALSRVEETLFRETTTLGVRRHRVERTKLTREARLVQTEYGPVPVKVGRLGGEELTASPEFEDCRRIALERNVPLRRVVEAARRAFSEGS